MSLAIEVDHDRLADFCQRHHIRHLSFFGSVIHDDFGPESDVDVLVQFGEGQTPSLFGIVDMEFELSELLGHKADLRTPEDFSRYFRDKVMAEAVTQYVA